MSIMGWTSSKTQEILVGFVTGSWFVDAWLNCKTHSSAVKLWCVNPSDRVSWNSLHCHDTVSNAFQIKLFCTGSIILSLQKKGAWVELIFGNAESASCLKQQCLCRRKSETRMKKETLSNFLVAFVCKTLLENDCFTNRLHFLIMTAILLFFVLWSQAHHMIFMQGSSLTPRKSFFVMLWFFASITFTAPKQHKAHSGTNSNA